AASWGRPRSKPRYQSFGARQTAEDIIQRSERAAAPDLRFATARRAVRPRPTGPRGRRGTGRAPAGRCGVPWRSLRPACRCSRRPRRACRPTLSPGTAALAFAARRWARAAASTTREAWSAEITAIPDLPGHAFREAVLIGEVEHVPAPVHEHQVVEALNGFVRTFHLPSAPDDLGGIDDVPEPEDQSRLRNDPSER